MESIQIHPANASTPFHQITCLYAPLSFDENNIAFKDIKDAINHCDPQFPIRIQVSQPIDFTNFPNCIRYLATQSTAYHITLEPLSPKEMSRNTLLHEVYLHLARKHAQIPLQAHIQSMPSLADSKKIRRAKQMLNQGTQIQIQTQQQHHQHKEHATQVVQEQQQQVQQQMAQTRENQIQQQQQRLQQLNHQNTPVDISALGTLIHEGNLELLVTPTFSLDEAKSLWFNLVGQYATKVDTPNNRISHVPINTLKLIAKYKDQFSDGIHFDDLPNGFGFRVREIEQDGKTIQQSILYYDKKLIEQSDDQRRDSPLAARMTEDKTDQPFGTVGQFYPFSSFQEESYQTFIKTHQPIFETLITPKIQTKLTAKLDALVHLILLDNPRLEPEKNSLKHQLKELIQTSKSANIHCAIDGLRGILFDKGAEGIALFLKKIQALKKSGHFEHFHYLFMDNSNDWRNLISSTSSRKDELSALKAIDYLISMPPEQYSWWQSMTEQHAKTNPKPLMLIDLVNAHRYFFEQVKGIDPGLNLPLTCPIKDIRNMKTAYARILYVLKKALAPQEQAQHLEQLDFGMQGVICGASRGPYHLVTHEMQLTPDFAPFDWEKVRAYAPKYPKSAGWCRIKPYKGDPSVFDTAITLHCPTEPYIIYSQINIFHDATDYEYRKFRYNKVACISGLAEAPDGSIFFRHVYLRNNLPQQPGETKQYQLDCERMSPIEDDIFIDNKEHCYFSYSEVMVPPSHDNVLAHYRKTKSCEMLSNPDEDFGMILGRRLIQPLQKIPKQLIDECKIKKARPQTLSYDINIDTLIELIQKNALFSDCVMYFYRFIGTQINAFSFTQYVQLKNDLDQSVLSPDKTVNDSLKKHLLLWLAIGTTGMRALKQERDLVADLEQLVLRISQRSPKTKLLADVAKTCGHITPKPTLHELSALLLLTDNEHHINALFTAAQQHGESVYQALVYLSQRSEPLEAEQLHLWLSFLEDLPTALTSHQRSCCILLSSVTTVSSWPQLAQLIESLQHIPEEILVHLQSLLQRISISDSTGLVSSDNIQQLFELLTEISLEDSSLRTQIIGTTCQALPTLKFKEDSVTNATAHFIRSMTPFIHELEGLLGVLDDISPPQEVWFISIYFEKIAQFLQQFKETFAVEINELKKLISELVTNEDADAMPTILKKMQSIIDLLGKTIDGFSLGTAPMAALCAAAVRTILTVVKDRILNTFAKRFTQAVHLQLSDSVLRLGIHDAVLNQSSEKDTKLSVVFKDCLIAQLPPIRGKELILEMKAMFIQQEMLEQFIKRCKQVGDSPRRNALLAMLYRQNYFKNPNALIGIEQLSELISCFIGHQHVNLESALTTLFQARAANISMDKIQAKLSYLSQHAHQFNHLEFQLLLQLSIHVELPLHEVIGLKNHLSQAAFGLLLDTATTESLTSCAVVLNTYLQTNPAHGPYFSDYLHVVLSNKEQRSQGVTSIEDLVAFLNEVPPLQTAILTVLQGACWTKEMGQSIPIARQIALIKQLSHIPNCLEKLQVLYTKRPSPSFTALEAHVDDVDAFINAYEFDPFGRREQMKSACDLQGVDSFIADISYLLNQQPLEADNATRLKHHVSYILGIATQYGLPIDGQIKPICQFTHAEIQGYYALCQQRLRDNSADSSAKLEGLAIQCEALFRTTGKYPYPSQIISVLNTLLFDGSLLLQIPTGQGKSLTLALMAAMTHSFSNQAMHVTVSSRNKLLTGRDYQESLDFYNYLNIPVALVQASTEENHYLTPTIVYSTTADKALYDSKLKVVDQISFPSKSQRVVLCDEADAEFFDNKNAFNFSEGNENPYVNPLEWLYPHVNAFIETPEFQNEHFSTEEDVENLRRVLKIQNKPKYDASFDRLTDFKLSQLLDAACAAKQLVEKTHFLVRQKTREVNGVMQTISEAHVLDLISHAEDTEATLSYGVQQCLHARLDVIYATEIAQYKATQGKQGKPPFSCDNQIECVDSQNAHSFFKAHGRIIGCTGTAGTSNELHELVSELDIKTLVNIPPRRRGQLQYLPPVFADNSTSFFFGTGSQTACIERTLKKARHQPVLISCENIHKAEALFTALQRQWGDNVQLIHAENASNADEFEQRVEKAKNPGMITIATPLAARGVDIKTQSAAGSQKKRAQLAEKLLVIETAIDSERSRRQLQGRAGRDMKTGQTVCIFDLQDILQKYGIDLHPLSRQDKLLAIQQITDKLDTEACFERSIRLKIDSLLHHYETILDTWYKKADENTQPKILAAKTQFIDAFHHAWQDYLADSDSHGKYPNPYLRYKEDKTLDTGVLDDLVQAFATKVHDKIAPECLATIQHGEFTLLSAAPAIEPQQASREMPNVLDADASMAQIYLALAPQSTTYQEHIQFKQAVDEGVQFWIMQNKKASYAVKKLAQTQTSAVLDGLIQDNGQPIEHIHLSWLDAVTKTMQSTKEFSLKTLSDYLTLHALALTDANLKLDSKLIADTETLIAQRTKLFLEHALNPHWIPLKNTVDIQKIKALHLRISELEVSNYNALQTVLMPLFNQPEYQPKSNVVCEYFQSIQQSINAIAFKTAPAVMQTATEKTKTQTYLEQLERIGKRLQERADKAGFWKDKALYQAKVQHFDAYIQQLKTLIENKKSHGINNVDNDIRALTTRMQQDASLYTSTARFFKLERNVTVMKEVQQATKEFFKP